MQSGEFFISGLQISFIILKILNKIRWSWWWVLSPMWICASVLLFVLFGYTIYLAVTR